MAFPTKVSTPTAITAYSKQDVSCQHVTTSDFMQFNVSFAKELVPKQRYEFEHETFTRLEPLSVPTFGRAKIQHRAFWVPFRTVFNGWIDFISDTPHVYNNSSSGIISNVPIITNKTLVEFLLSAPITEEVANSTQAYDIAIYRGTLGNFTYRKFTNKGRVAYKILRTLGYGILLDDRIDKSYSAMPILCLTRVFCDWYFPAQYANSSVMDIIHHLFIRNDEPLSNVSYITNNQLVAIFTQFERLAYDADYFTAAWDNPSCPNSGLSSNFVINDIVNEDSTIRNDDKSAFAIPDHGVITHYMLDALHSLTDYLKRHQIAGSRAIDRYAARFGIKLTSEKLNRSVLLESYSQNIQFGDVTSTADTETAHLGAFAGKALSMGDGKFMVDTNGEFGMLIVISTIVPKTEYYQGIDRQILHTTKLDFFTPEFDNLGTQAQSAMELYVPDHKTTHIQSLFDVDYQDKVFGFVPRYAEYKVGRSLITGDYVLNSMNAGKDSWTLFRDVSGYRADLDDYVHSYDFVTSADSKQYNRIFWNTDDNADHFNIIHNFKITSHFPGRSLFDDYEFKDEEKAQNVTLDNGGTNLN